MSNKYIKITKDNIESLYIPYKDQFIFWAKMNQLITNFCNSSHLEDFEEIFDEDGERLWKHFRLDCSGSYEKFKTYLTKEQHNIFIISLWTNQDNKFYKL